MKCLRSYFTGDKTIWIMVIVLMIISFVSVYSSVGSIAYRSAAKDTTDYIFSHLKHLLIGLVIMFLVHRASYGYLYSLYHVIIITAGILLVLTLFAGRVQNDARRWFMLGPISIQTSEIARIAIVIFIARVLSVNQESKEASLQAFKKIMWVVGIICLLIVPSNLSMVILIFATSLILMFVGNIPVKYLAVTVGVSFLLALLVIFVVPQIPILSRSATWKNRVVSFFDEGKENPQVTLSKKAIASSNFIGKGPGNSVVKYKLKNASTDFIFPIIIEELGTIIGILVLLIYLALLLKVVQIVKRLKNYFAAFLATGLILNIVFQAFINMAVGVNMMPVTGQPLPLVSWGGTSLVITFISLGIILNISREVEKNELN